MTPEQRRVAIGISISIGLTYLVGAGLAFLIEPMSEDLRISDARVEFVLSVPSVASITVIFIAGQAGDRFGHRRALLILSGAFIAGSMLLAGAQEIVEVIAGLALCGGSATAVQIVTFGLLQECFPEGKARVSAFTTFGMIYPMALMVFPVLTGGLLDVAAWRLVPVVWAVAGVAMAGVVRFLVPNTTEVRPFGDWLTLLLAGFVVAQGVRFLDIIGRNGITASRTLISSAVLTAALIAFAVRFRTVVARGFSLAPRLDALTRGLLLSVAVVSIVSTLTYVIVALEYLYDMTPLKAAIAVIPAQACGALGAKFLAGGAIKRWGATRAGQHLLLVLAISLLTLVGVRPAAPAWYLVVCAILVTTADSAALTVLDTAVMSYAPPGHAGTFSAVRGAVTEIGVGLSVVVLGTHVINAVKISAGAGGVRAAQAQQLAWGLRLDGILGFTIVLIAWLALMIITRGGFTKLWQARDSLP